MSGVEGWRDFARPFWSADEVQSALPHVVDHLVAHRLIAYPTETVYGFGGMVDHASVEALVALKRRPPAKPFLVLVSGSAMIERLGLHMSPEAARLAATHWPGPLTLVLPGGEGQLPARLRGPEGGIAVRWTSHPGLQRLIASLGSPITSTSANLPGVPPATSAVEVVAQWRPVIARGALMVLDGGTLTPSPPSTVVDCTTRRLRVIRPGAIAAATLRRTVPDLIGDA
ncbi:MAG: L-threonylcarbamoyladenylate synthase [Gemmatimonadaceae bacterium]|nr:L-threonylcarbamoyladenylate synthase [Gemmatimonadaceae bacterium]